MRGISAFVLAALAACSVSAQDRRETQPPSTQVEEIYVVRSVPESVTPPTKYCAQTRTGFSGATAEGQFTFRSTATRVSDGRMIDMNMTAIGSIRVCFGPVQNAGIYNWYAEGALGSTAFKGNGECHRQKADFPERGLRTVNCFVDLSGLPSEYVGGLLTTNSMTSLKNQGMETDPPGYTQASIATIRLWRKRDAPPSGTTLSKESLVGTWKLVSFTETNEKGEVKDFYGPNPIGFLTYTADGRISVVIADSARKPLSTGATSSIGERSAAFSTFVSYAGSYSFAAGKVIHHIEVASIQNLANTDQVRTVNLQSDRLTLRTPPLRFSGVPMAYAELVWERLKPQTTDK
jgi:hypothetical protein